MSDNAEEPVSSHTDPGFSPETMRPHGRPSVVALMADDPTSAVLQLVHDRLAPDGWEGPLVSGFWWLPWKLRHEIRIVGECIFNRGIVPDQE